MRARDWQSILVTGSWPLANCEPFWLFWFWERAWIMPASENDKTVRENRRDSQEERLTCADDLLDLIMRLTDPTNRSSEHIAPPSLRNCLTFAPYENAFYLRCAREHLSIPSPFNLIITFCRRPEESKIERRRWSLRVEEIRNCEDWPKGILRVRGSDWFSEFVFTFRTNRASNIFSLLKFSTLESTTPKPALRNFGSTKLGSPKHLPMWMKCLPPQVWRSQRSGRGSVRKAF